MQPTLSTPTELDEQVFFLLNYGTGYDLEAVERMPIYKRMWHVSRLYKKLKDEQDAQEQAIREAKQRR